MLARLIVWKALALALLLLLSPLENLLAQDNTRPNTLFIFDSTSPLSVSFIVNVLESHGGRADHIFPSGCVIGYLPAGNELKLRSEFPRLRVEHQTVNTENFKESEGCAELAATIWNMSFQKQLSPELNPRVTSAPRSPPNDARIAPDRRTERRDQGETSRAAAKAPGFMETSEYLVGSVVVGIITPESKGGIDASTENWTSSRRNAVVSQIMQGLQWWKDNANAPANLTFVYDIHHGIATSYEPIKRSSSDEDLWISQVMSNLGYPGSPSSYFSQVRGYLNDARAALGTDWAFAIFVVDSLNDADGTFANGDFAYTYVNGPFMVMTYDNDGWGIDRMQIVVAHEHGHIWGALDEYASSGCTDTEESGYLDIANSNCENGSPPSEDSIMRNAADQEDVAYPNHLVSTPARQMVGWRDLDGDGKQLYDPVDTIPAATLTSFNPNPTPNNTPTYSGSAQDLPFPSPTHVPVSINKIVGVEWQVDGGTWQPAAPADGAFDSDFENFTFTPSPLTVGTHTFNVRATNTVGNISALASHTLTILPPLPALSINDIHVNEGNSGMTSGVFTVTLSGSSSQTVTVNYSTGNGSATAGTDYVGKSGSVTFNPGETSKTITISVIGDTIPEANKAFFVNLTSAVNVTIADGQGLGTIIDDDPISQPTVDFDGDGRSDVGIYRNGTWTVIRSTDGGVTNKVWGGGGWVPVPADYDGDGKIDVAVYNASGLWSIVRSSDGGNTLIGWSGAPGDIPVPADYDGDGKADLAVYNPTTAGWSIIRSSDGGLMYKTWGGPAWMPVEADYDGDGKVDIAVRNPSNGLWSIVRSTDGGNTLIGWSAAANDIPVPADYDGDGKADLAVYNTATAGWSIIRSSDGGLTYKAWGGPAWEPVMADYDGDGKTDIAVYNATNGLWSIVRSSDGGNTLVSLGGAPQDIPLN